MFTLVKCQDSIRIPPEKFAQNLKEAALSELIKRYEGIISKELGYVIAVVSVDIEPIGRILPGDGATYHSVNFELLTYKPEIQEVVEGEVIEIGDYGAFVRVGPVESLLHISQVMDDYLSYDEKQGLLVGKETRRKLSKGDKVRARITAVSMARGGSSGKIGITTRQPFLGKLEWIKEDLKVAEARVGAPAGKVVEKPTRKAG
ncbi:MAG: DNA-directed RNA polymerase [Candidatus Bathyarchaeia archaeon]